MKGNQKCNVCAGNRMSTINSYKHDWLSCNDCGNIFRHRKEKYYMPRILNRNIAKNIFSSNTINMLYPMHEVIKEEKCFYDYYDEASKLKVEETKWFGQIKRIKKSLEQYNISLEGKKILDVSGGPGFVAVELEKVAEKVVVTEFSQTAVDGMKKNLEVNAVKFDYKSNKIYEVLKEKFDIILINYSINFCADLKSFIGDLRNIVHKDSIVYVSFVLPTLGCCLRWQFDEYTYNVLYHPETMGRIFAEEGFTSVVKKSDGNFGYMNNLSLKVRLFRLVLTIWYNFKSLSPTLSINRELIQKNELHIYKYTGG